MTTHVTIYDIFFKHPKGYLVVKFCREMAEYLKIAKPLFKKRAGAV
jgi:NADH:ubiquinone oxidoreductase subunit E